MVLVAPIGLRSLPDQLEVMVDVIKVFLVRLVVIPAVEVLDESYTLAGVFCQVDRVTLRSLF